MFFRSILPVAAVLSLAVAGAAAAQTRVVAPDGKGAMTLPAGIERHPLADDTEGRISIIVRHPGQTGLDWAGICVASFSSPENPSTKENWALVSQLYSGDPEAKGRDRAGKGGHTYQNPVDNRALTSSTGWAGWFFAYNQKSKDGEDQTIVNTATQLSPTIRLIVGCTSDNGYYTKADLDLIYKFVSSASLP